MTSAADGDGFEAQHSCFEVASCWRALSGELRTHAQHEDRGKVRETGRGGTYH